MSVIESSLPSGANPNRYRPHTFRLGVGGTCERCEGNRIENQHRPEEITAYSLERIADTVETLAKVDAGGIMGMLFGGKR